MKKCFGYVRVSTVKQGEGVSLEAQKDAITQFAVRNSIEIVEWFEEKETAAKRGRPIFTSMMKRLLKRQAHGVVLHKIDRGARNLSDWAKFAELADAGIDVHFATETLDFRSRGGRLTADIQAVIAADYVRNLREECIKGIDGRLKQGLYPFKAPLGYNDNGGGRVKTIDPVKGPIVRKAFELYAARKHSLRSLPQELARLGLTTPRGTPISKNCIEKVLKNPFYCGIIRTTRHGAVHRGIHEPLISQTLFDTVQDVRLNKSAKKAIRKQHLFQGLFICALCSHGMIAEYQKGHTYYRCQTPTCGTKTVREEMIEVALLDVLTRVSLSDDHVQQLTMLLVEWIEHQHAEDNTSNVKMQIANVEDRLAKLTDALIDRLIGNEDFVTRKEQLIAERLRYEETLTKQSDIPTRAEIEKFLELVQSLANNYKSAVPDEKREIIELATSNRRVELRNVYVEPANWLLDTTTAITGLLGGLSRHTPRRTPIMRREHFEQLVEGMKQIRRDKDLKSIGGAT